jgi:hypothetical protein
MSASSRSIHGRVANQSFSVVVLTRPPRLAIILTGEAIRRDNARAIADIFAAQRGNFVCASAGHNLSNT